ncbi:radical SAM protein [Geotalea sp. SG265]|uniref:B12-binding domain-containing radical SAM protein n=1 Tax=Geotalea sp. SG265 TaxID=2922867 RepID=UPI001FAFB781|nr:radical SAM protein [Geotalea sp. SG265]
MTQILLAYKSNLAGANDPYTSLLPVGLGYLHAVLKVRGYDATIANFSRLSWKETEATVTRLRPKVLGISQFTHNRFEALKLAALAKKLDSGTFVVFGGPHATHQSRELLERHQDVDAVVLGEGEETFCELVTTLEGEVRDLSEVRGIAFRSAQGIIETAARPPIADLDSLPFPAAQMDRACVGVDLHRQLEFLITSRGCPAACLFCSSPLFWGKSLRLRSPRNMVDEIKLIRDRFGLIYFSIRDDTFTADRKRVLEFCRIIRQEKVYILWNCQSRVTAVDGEMLLEMKRAGCECIQFGVESGSPRILKALGKGIGTDQVKKAAALVRKAGMNLSIYLITGVSGETDGDTYATIGLVEAIQAHDGQVSPLAYYPGTEIFNKGVADGSIAGDSFERDKQEALYVRKDKFVEASTRRLLQAVVRTGKKASYGAEHFRSHKKVLGYCHGTNIMAGEMYEERGQWHLAEREYREITEKEPENPWGWLLLGGLYGGRGLVDEACMAYRRVMTIVPAHAPAFSDLGELMMLTGRGGEALKYFRKALELDPYDAKAREALRQK